MNKKVLVCASSQDFIMSGATAYFIRMFDWAKSHNFQCVLLLRKDCKIAPIWEEKIRQLGISVNYFKLLSPTFITGAYNWDAADEKYFITADIHCYFRLKRMEYKGCLGCSKILWYILHPETTRICENKILNFPYKKWCLSELNDNVIFMDSECALACRNYYQTAMHLPCIRLGEVIPEKEDPIIKRRIEERKKTFTILTITRFKFPAKGYLLGLIDTFEKLSADYPSIQLKIIGDGKGKSQVLQKMEMLPANIRQKIECIGNVPYDKLKEYFRTAHIFVGMGTTLLDAAGYALPGIIATAYQTDDLSVGLFAENYDNLGGNVDLSDNKSSCFYKEIENILNMNDKDYYAAEEQAYSVVKKYYDINIVMPQILDKCKKTDKSKKNWGVLAVYDNFIIILKSIYHWLNGKKLK